MATEFIFIVVDDTDDSQHEVRVRASSYSVALSHLSDKFPSGFVVGHRSVEAPDSDEPEPAA